MLEFDVKLEVQYDPNGHGGLAMDQCVLCHEGSGCILTSSTAFRAVGGPPWSLVADSSHPTKTNKFNYNGEYKKATLLAFTSHHLFFFNRQLPPAWLKTFITLLFDMYSMLLVSVSVLLSATTH
jgi:hypothetical protein